MSLWRNSSKVAKRPQDFQCQRGVVVAASISSFGNGRQRGSVVCGGFGIL
jgi:hypothetical protein